jgi:isoleucyl-tRNA synthetase
MPERSPRYPTVDPQPRFPEIERRVLEYWDRESIFRESVERRFAWDCHGLPAEMQAEKELGVSGRAQIQDYGIGRFNDHCRKSVMAFTIEWERYVRRQARWVDFAND